MNSGKDVGRRLESKSDDHLQPPVDPAPSGFFGWNTFSGVVHHIVNKFSRSSVPTTSTVSPPPTTTAAADSPTRSQANDEGGGQDPRSSELRDRNDTRPLSLYQMNLRGVLSDGGRVDGVRGGQNDVDGTLGRPPTPCSKDGYPQFRKESSILTKSASNTIIHSPSYSSPYSGPVGQMPAVHLSPRQRPLLLRNEDRAKPVMVKIAQPDPLHTSLIRRRSVDDSNENNSSNVDHSVQKETVIDALKKRKRTHLEQDENETRDNEESAQLSKRRCSRDDALSAPETHISRGMKRRALHDDFGDTGETTDQSPDVVEGAVKKICQNSSPPSRRFGCGARNTIAASYSSHLRWEERIMRAKSLTQSQAASSQDESMPLVEDGGRASSRTSHCSSHFSRPSRANSPTHQDEDLRSGLRSDRAHSIQNSDRSTPLNLMSRLHDVDSTQRAPLLLHDGSVKNRVTMLSSVSSSSPSVTPLPDLETQLVESSELKAPVEFTADDLERDRDLLNSRASRLLLGFFDGDDQIDSIVEPASTVPLPTTSGFVLGLASTAIPASGAAPVSTTVTAGATDHQVQTSANSGITSASVLKSNIDGASLTDSTAVSQNPSISTSTQEQGRFASSITANAGFNFGSSTGIVNPSATLSISTVTVSATGTITTTQDSSGSHLNPGKSLGPSDSGVKGFNAGTSSFGTFLVPSGGAPDGSANSLNGRSFAPSALTTAAGSTTASVVSAFGTASNVQPTVVSFGNTGNTVPKSATSLTSAFPALGDTRVTSGFFGNTVGGSSGGGDSVVAATTAAKNSAQMTVGGFAFGKLSSTQATAGNLGNAKPLVVTAQTTASGLSFGNMSTMQTTASGLAFGNAGPAPATANSFAFGNSGTTQTTVNSFSFPNSGANQTTASSNAFGNLGNMQTTASSSAFGNLGATQTTTSSFSFGNSGPVQTPASSFAFGNSGTLPTTALGTSQNTANSFSFGTSANIQTTANSLAFGTSANAQTTANSLAFGTSANAQTTASNFSFGNSGATQSVAGGFAFGNASTNLSTSNMSGSVPTTASTFAFGNSSSKQMVGGAFGNAGNAQTTTNSSFAGLAATPQFSFGKSSAPTTANPSTAGGFAFGNVQQHQASGSNLTTANPFGNNIPTANAFGSTSATPNTFGNNTAVANTFGSTAATPSTFGSNVTTANTFGSNATMANTFGSNATMANTFGSNAATANTFGSTQPPVNPFNSSTATANPFGGNASTANPFGTPNNNFDNKPSGLQFNRPDVAATNQSTPQDLRRVLFPSTPSNNSTLAATLHSTPSQPHQQLAFNFFGSKTDGNSNSVNSSGGFAFGKTSAPASTFGSNSTAGGFAFGKTAGSNPPQPANQGFNFPGATQSGTNSLMPNTGFGFNAVSQPSTNSQIPNTGFNFQGAAQQGTNPHAPITGFNFNAATPSFAFGQMPNPPANGLPSIASFSAGPKFTPGTTYGVSSSRTLRTKKKGR